MGFLNKIFKRHSVKKASYSPVEEKRKQLIANKVDVSSLEDPFKVEEVIPDPIIPPQFPLEEEIKALEKIIELEKDMANSSGTPYLWDERKFFVLNRKEFLKFHPNSYIIVKGQKNCGVFDNLDQALLDGVKKFGSEPFLVHKVCADKRNETVHYIKHIKHIES